MACLDLVADWSRHLRVNNYSPRTIEKYAYPIHRLGAWLVATERPRLHSLTEDDLEAFLDTLGDHGPAKAAYAQAFHSLFGYATRKGVFARDPTANLHPRLAPPEPADSYTREELLVLLSTAFQHHPRYGWSIGLCYYTGTRRSEVTGMRPEHIVGTKVEVRGKGDKTRWIPLSAGARTCIEALAPWSDGTILGAKPQTFTMWVHRVAEEAGFPPGRRHAHLLRATFASHLEQAGVAPSVIQRLLGHTNLKTTSRYFHRKTEQEERDAVDLL